MVIGPLTRNTISLFTEEARGLGFVGVGFSRPERPLFFDEFCTWLSPRRHGEMTWLERNLKIRENPLGLLDGCRTVISLAYPYPSRKPCTPDGFTAARYAEPEKADYHDRLRALAGRLAKRIVEWYPGTVKV